MDEQGGAGYSQQPLWDHQSSTMSIASTSGAPANTTIDVEIEYHDETQAYAGFWDQQITFADKADLEDKVKEFLETQLGGVFTVTVTESLGYFYITDIVGTASRGYILEFNVYTNRDGWTYHPRTKVAYQNPYVEAALTLIESQLSTNSDVACVWEGNSDLVTSLGTGRLEVYFIINSSSIDGGIKIYDKDNDVISEAYYRYTTAPSGSGYDCHRRYDLARISGTSALSPWNNRGPLPVQIMNWSGSNYMQMNLGESFGS